MAIGFVDLLVQCMVRHLGFSGWPDIVGVSALGIVEVVLMLIWIERK